MLMLMLIPILIHSYPDGPNAGSNADSDAGSDAELGARGAGRDGNGSGTLDDPEHQGRRAHELGAQNQPQCRQHPPAPPRLPRPPTGSFSS
eukprot:2737296-Rhodomonas_salina.1